MKTLLIGAGRKTEKTVATITGGKHIALSREPITGDIVRLDINPDHEPDVLHDLNIRPLPFEDNTFDEIHAYEVLEHIGVQGDYKGFFEEFSEYWRILKPGGKLIGTCPHWRSVWAWGDPSHTRVLPIETFVFLSQVEYKNQVGRVCFIKQTYLANIGNDQAYFVLEAVKPSRL